MKFGRSKSRSEPLGEEKKPLALASTRMSKIFLDRSVYFLVTVTNELPRIL